MQRFPLFDFLSEKALSLKNENIDMFYLGSTITNLCDRKHYENIAALCLHYEELTKKKTIFPSAFTTLHGGKGLICSINKLPEPLIRIISVYINSL